MRVASPLPMQSGGIKLQIVYSIYHAISFQQSVSVIAGYEIQRKLPVCIQNEGGRDNLAVEDKSIACSSCQSHTKCNNDDEHQSERNVHS